MITFVNLMTLSPPPPKKNVQNLCFVVVSLLAISSQLLKSKIRTFSFKIYIYKSGVQNNLLVLIISKSIYTTHGTIVNHLLTYSLTICEYS